MKVHWCGAGFWLLLLGPVYSTGQAIPDLVAEHGFADVILTGGKW